MDDTRIRFLSAIVGRLGAERIVELHLFSSIRQGVLETGVAVVAVMPEGDQGGVPAEPDPSPYADVQLPAAPATSEMLSPTDPVAPNNDGEGRHVVYTARYRLTRKGPDRGKWLFEIAATADAPLATVEHVARGVTLRSRDLTDTERLSGEQLRALMGDPAWQTAT